MKRIFALTLLVVLAAALYGATLNGWLDLPVLATPGAAPTGWARLFINSSTGKLDCVDASGSSCAPTGSASYPAGGIPQSTGTAWGSSLTLDTDGTMAANSDSRIPSQKSVVTYVAAHSGGAGQQQLSAQAGSVTSGLTRYFGYSTGGTSESLAWKQVNGAHTLSHMTCWASATTGGSDAAHTATFTLRVNNTSVTPTVSLNSASTAGPVAGSLIATDSTDTAAVAAGSMVDFMLVTGASTSSATYGCSVVMQ